MPASNSTCFDDWRPILLVMSLEAISTQLCYFFVFEFIAMYIYGCFQIFCITFRDSVSKHCGEVRAIGIQCIPKLICWKNNNVGVSSFIIRVLQVRCCPYCLFEAKGSIFSWLRRRVYLLTNSKSTMVEKRMVPTLLSLFLHDRTSSSFHIWSFYQSRFFISHFFECES